eukprot:CAMPEP_0170635976 /NCGR_PEP_ID=MMETSP0224-20130122/37526_1 /TAXON_ID=285029 /ORGANISM="Togula jolla, Strain CCCM 725" /LENGTH=54 /DNA_ID=CAMNT_0010965547 /DNA_START=103 /DNA_END=264 /DNA_ORIENTATION=+
MAVPSSMASGSGCGLASAPLKATGKGTIGYRAGILRRCKKFFADGAGPSRSKKE